MESFQGLSNKYVDINCTIAKLLKYAMFSLGNGNNELWCKQDGKNEQVNYCEILPIFFYQACILST